MNRWVAGARPRTLPASVVPVVVGTATGSTAGPLTGWRIAAAMVVALAIQVGTNYANDYSDGIRGTDTGRAGPTRLVAGGLAAPGAVRAAALTAFGVAGCAGLALAAATTWWLTLVGAACFAAGWLYTGGPAPYGYLGFGDLAVFVFFGPVAVVGTAYVTSGRLPALAWLAAVPVGLLAVALLVANNLRDIPTDRASGKRTSAVRLGDSRTRLLYAGCVGAPFVLALGCVALRPWAALALLAAPVAVPPLRAVRCGARGRDLIPVLAGTGRVQLAFGALLALGLAR